MPGFEPRKHWWEASALTMHSVILFPEKPGTVKSPLGGHFPKTYT